jgi:hypothetical protein
MTTRAASLCAIFGGLAWLLPARASAELLETVAISLSTADRMSIVDQVCRRPAGVSAENFDARRATSPSDNGSRPIYVNVICVAHSYVLGHRVKRLASCNNSHGRWSCTSGDFLEYGLWPGPDYLELLSGSDIATDLEVVKSLLLLRTFRGHDLADLMEGQSCSVKPKSQDRWELVCGVTSISVERECASGSCRFQPIDVVIPLV